MVLGRVKVSQDEHRLKVGVLRVGKLLNGICAYEWRVDVLKRRFTFKQDTWRKQLILTHPCHRSRDHNHARAGTKHGSDTLALPI